MKRIGISLRKLDGQAPEFLWTLKKNPNPQLPGQEKSYVRDCICGIVNHTMMDGNGYVEGIDEEVVHSTLLIYRTLLCLYWHSHCARILLVMTRIDHVDGQITTNFIKVHPWVSQSGLFPK